MTTLDLRGASTTIRGTAGADMSVSITFTDSAGDPVDVSGYTAAADVLRGSTVVDSFASAVSGAGSNVLTLTLTDAETLAIGSERRLRWRLSMTAGGVTEQWISGGFELSPFGEPAASNTTSLSVQVSGAITATVQTPLPLATLDGRYAPYITTAPRTALYLPGTSGNYVSAPDFALGSQDIEIVALVAPNDWTPAAQSAIVSQSNGTPVFFLALNTAGTFTLRIRNTAGTPVIPRSRHLRV